MESYSIKIKNMSLEKYIEFYNKTMYPLNYPYKLRAGLRQSPKDSIKMILQIGIPRDDYENIDSETIYDFQDILTINGDTDEEVIELFEKVELDCNLKEYFKKLWNK